MTTDDYGGRDTTCLSDVVRVRGQGDQGTTIVGGITYPVSYLQESVFGGGRFHSGRRRLPAMMNDGDGGKIDGGAIKGGV